MSHYLILVCLSNYYLKDKDEKHGLSNSVRAVKRGISGAYLLIYSLVLV